MSRFPRWLHDIADTILDREAANYTRQLSSMDHIFTNSENVYGRLLKYCGFQSDVLYPPTDISRFTPAINNDGETRDSGIFDSYFFSFARLSPPKRIDIIVDAFIDIPDQNLIFTYGKNDPMKDEILKKIQ